MKGDFVLRNNTNGPAKSGISQERIRKFAEPYVGMPIYLDDSFFDFIDEDRGRNCPIDDDMGDEMDNCMMPGGCPMPGNGEMMPGTCPMPENGRMMPGTCPMPGNGRMMPGTCPMPENGGMMPETEMPEAAPMPMPAPAPTPAPAPMPTPAPAPMPMPTPAPMPMPTPMPTPAPAPMPMPVDCAGTCPLAMAYVPWQVWDMTYEMEEGFAVGTIFPELDLPFLGGATK